jgi:putative sterol carrier protein
MAKYFSEEFFKEVEVKLGADPTWQQATKGVKSTIKLSTTDQGTSFLLTIEEGATRIGKTDAAMQAEFSFEGTYEAWSKVARGEVDLQSAVLKGHLRFRGSITKILFYKDRFVRIADVMKSVPLEF